jgi:hypothetical protein
MYLPGHGRQVTILQNKFLPSLRPHVATSGMELPIDLGRDRELMQFGVYTPLSNHPWSGADRPCRFPDALEEYLFLTDPVREITLLKLHSYYLRGKSYS